MNEFKSYLEMKREKFSREAVQDKLLHEALLARKSHSESGHQLILSEPVKQVKSQHTGIKTELKRMITLFNHS